MKWHACTLRQCIDLAEKVGIVTEAHLYSGELIVVDGNTKDGTLFTITMSLKEEVNTDGN